MAWSARDGPAQQEACSLLFTDGNTQRQLLSELSACAMTYSCKDMELVRRIYNLRVVVDTVQMASKCPALGELLVAAPCRADVTLQMAVGQWLMHEATMAMREGGKAALCGACHHALVPVQSDVCGRRGEDITHACPLCLWRSQLPFLFWKAVHSNLLIVAVFFAINSIPSFVQMRAPRSPALHPSDASIGSGQWIQIVGHVTSVVFLHRESMNPEPVVELQSLLANCRGLSGRSPIWVDLSLLPQSEVQGAAVIGERIHVIGLLEVDAGGPGKPMRTGHGAPVAQLLIKARAVVTAGCTSWQPNSLSLGTTATEASPCVDRTQSYFVDADADFEFRSLLEARCSWDCAAGAAAFASAKAAGGFLLQGNRFRTQAMLEASQVYVLPTALWVAVGMVLTLSTLHECGIVGTIVGPPGALSIVRSFLLELESETGGVLTLVHGVERMLLPTYSRVTAVQASLPAGVNAEGHVELVRGGLLNTAHQRLMFVPLLHAISATGLRAVQGALGEKGHVVVREGGQRVECRAVRALLGLTHEAGPVQQRHLFDFIERGDFVIHVSVNSVCSLSEQGNTLLAMLPSGDASNDAAVLERIHMFASQWDALCKRLLLLSGEGPSPPQLSSNCATLLHAYFIAAKANCAETATASMMSTLVKLTCAHALLRAGAHTLSTGSANMTTGVGNGACAAGRWPETNATALIDAAVAISLCDASLGFLTGLSLLGDSSLFDVVGARDGFDIVDYATEMHQHLVSSVPLELL
ncbi:hypothetical protein ERJ75_001446900 [Trypanosoma vivax]|nr:hypothetical protein ERJ75_001446900 [Trypanosoma vivax]